MIEQSSELLLGSADNRRGGALDELLEVLAEIAVDATKGPVHAGGELRVAS